MAPEVDLWTFTHTHMRRFGRLSKFPEPRVAGLKLRLLSGPQSSFGDCCFLPGACPTARHLLHCEYPIGIPSHPSALADSPCLQNPCHNDGRCQEQGDTFICHCDLGYGGEFCTEPRDIPSRKKLGNNHIPGLCPTGHCHRITVFNFHIHCIYYILLCF